MSRQEQARSARVDAWLASGGIVLAANERAARSLASAHHAARQAEGRTAWQTPAIFSWESWVRDQWLQQNKTGLMLLNPLQELSLWTQVISRSGAGEGLLHPRRLAASAQHAYSLLCTYSPDSLRTSTRAGWSGDPAIFSGWITGFESRCRREALISRSRLPLELTEAFESGATLLASTKDERPPLLLVGFDRLVRTQVSLLHAWDSWEHEEPGTSASSPQFLAAPDTATETEACVRWLHTRLTENPKARLIVVTTALEACRGELERALLDAPLHKGLDFEFSLGIPLGRVSLARSAILLLRWLHEPLSEPELDWLVSSGNCVASHDEEISLAGFMRELRRQGHEQPEWPIDDFTSATRSANQRSRTETGHAAWSARLLAARSHLQAGPLRQSPLQWISVVGELLDVIGWPGFRPLSSAAFQARERWGKVLEDCAALGFDGSQMDWPEFVSTLAEAISTTIFAPESSDARVQITEPLESAGQLADGIWFLGAQEDSWPGRGQAHPLLPAGLQRETGMPHASSQADWDLTQAATHRLLASADNVVVSYAKQSAEAETRPSRMIARLIGKPNDLPNQLAELKTGRHSSLTETFHDAALLPFPHTEIGGGAATLTRQSLCPFQAFATTRLNAEDWSPAEPGLNPKQRGQLLHSVLHRIWAGSAQGGISSLEDLQEITELRRFVATIVASVMTESFDPARRNSIPRGFPPRYLELEAQRLTRLVSEWLDYELLRMPFVVAETEARRDVIVAGLKLTLRLDRIDRFENGQELIVDYKSSEIGPSAWAGERPDDVQLPLYATFTAPDILEGLVFARVRPGQMKFCGRVRDAAASLQPGINPQNALVKSPLTGQQLEEWHDRIEQLAENFLAGRADVDPKDPRKTCEQCHLHTVCRIYENQSLAAALDENDEEQREDQESAGIDA